MKTKFYILGVLAVLCLLGTGYYAWTLYDAYRKQVEEWNEVAKTTFDEALWNEVDKRASRPFYHYSSFQGGMTTLKAKIPDTVRVMTATGFRKFKIERYKYDHSLAPETEKRAMTGFLLTKYPLSVDTLVIRWDSLLVDNLIVAEKRIRYIYTDEDLQNDTFFTAWKGKTPDSLTVRYLGFRCEYELVGYVSYPFWLSLLSLSEWGFLLLPWCVWGLLFAVYNPLECLVRKRFVREMVVEKEVHVADVKIDEAKIFLLPDGSLLDSYSRTLTNGQFSKRLSPQSIILLKLFLRKEYHSLSSIEIEKELWDGKGSADRLHKAIQRLRTDLKDVSSKIVIKNVNGSYELISPISSNKSKLEESKI